MGIWESLLAGGINAFASKLDADNKVVELEEEAMTQDGNARRAKESAGFNAMRQEMESGQVIGQIKADYGASGVAADSGSALDVLRHSHTMAELDRLSILHQGDMRAYGFQERAAAARTGIDRVNNMRRFNAFAALFQGGMRASEWGGGGRGEDSAKVDPGDTGFNLDGAQANDFAGDNPYTTGSGDDENVSLKYRRDWHLNVGPFAETPAPDTQSGNYRSYNYDAFRNGRGGGY